jgi:hypothetical protein
MNPTVFNQKVTEFMRDLIIAYPEIEHFKSLKALFTLVKNVAEDKPVQIFKTYIVRQYREHIMSRDENFFLNFDDYHKDIEVITQQPQYWNDFILQLKGMWTTMSADNKEAIWNYMSLLVLIADNIA